MQFQQQVSPRFKAKKDSILSSLATPIDKYTDLSPKGSVDEGVRELINLVNHLDGYVTTSSCAGRVSVFLEGVKGGIEGEASARDNEHGWAVDTEQRLPVPGGKGMGGRWLFVSHYPVLTEALRGTNPVHGLFQLTPSEGDAEDASASVDAMRFVRLQFEPMILHIMTSSLQHAQRILAAAMNAGFRESGLQSLKALDDDRALPMVAVRTAGLGVSSIVGIADWCSEGRLVAKSLVSENYLRMMLQLCNKRFEENTTRTARFVAAVECIATGLGSTSGPNLRKQAQWESKEARAERKRVEGLARQKAAAAAGQKVEMDTDTTEVLGVSDILGDNSRKAS